MRLLKERISLTLDEDVIEEIKLLAEERDRSVSQYINLVLKRHIKAIRQKKDQKEQR